MCRSFALFLVVLSARADVLFEENFDALSPVLQFQLDESAAPDLLGWTHAAPTGWTIDNSAMPSQQGVREWQGWSFTTLPFWDTVAGGQERSGFTRAAGVIAVADPDEWDDIGNPSASGRFDSALLSPVIATPAGAPLYLHFDSDYRQDNQQVGEVLAIYDGGTPEVLLRYDETTGSKRDRTVEIEVPARDGAGTVQFIWRLSNAGNDWWWAIDRVVVDTDALPPPPPRGPSPFGRRRALIVGVDGLRVDGYEVAETPHFDSLAASGGFALDALCTLGQPTVSGPGWSSICTGVWLDKHNVPNNSFTNPNYETYPHFFARIKERFPSAYLSSIVNWSPINTEILSEADFVVSGLSDDGVAEEAAAHLAGMGPDVLFLHFDDCDAAGHGTGFTPASATYLGAIESTDQRVGMVLEAIAARLETHPEEEWLILMTTDHGGTPGGTHGGQSDAERYVPFLANGHGVRPGAATTPVFIADVPALVCRHLRVPQQAAWDWDGRYDVLMPFAWEDLNADGAVDAIDVQILINGALSLPTPTDTDLDRDQATTALDLQRVINVALGAAAAT